METERNKFKRDSQAKGGKDSTKIVLTATGAAVVGASVATAANDWNNDEPDKTEVVSQAPVENAPHSTEGQAGQSEQPIHSNLEQPQNEILPIDSGQAIDQESNHDTSETIAQDNQNTDQQEPEKEDQPYDPSIDDVDPNMIAQEITAIEVDPNDVDLADVLIIDYMDTMYFEDGTEMPAALVHTEDNEQYLMVDIDDDMTFDVILDLEGNPIAPVDGNLTMSDVLDMFDETGNELAYNPETDELELAGGETPEQDIVDTEVYNELAMLDRQDEEMAIVNAVEDNDDGSTDGGDVLTNEDVNDLSGSDSESEEAEMIDDLEA